MTDFTAHCSWSIYRYLRCTEERPGQNASECAECETGGKGKLVYKLTTVLEYVLMLFS